MTNYTVAVRIKDDATYDDRYEGFTKALAASKAKGFWSEMTSLWFIESALDIDAFGKAISRPISASKDILLIREIGAKSTRYFGAFEHVNVLLSFMPEAKKLG